MPPLEAVGISSASWPRKTRPPLGALYDNTRRFANAEAALNDYVDADADLIAPVELVSLAWREGPGATALAIELECPLLKAAHIVGWRP